jgi:hypothetical protein
MQIVGQTNQKKAERASEGAPNQLIAFGSQEAKASQEPNGRQRQNKSTDHRDATNTHNWCAVLLAGIGLVSKTKVKAETSNERNQPDRESSCHKETHRGNHNRAGWEVH